MAELADAGPKKESSLVDIELGDRKADGTGRPREDDAGEQKKEKAPETIPGEEGERHESLSDIVQRLETTENGLSTAEAEKRLQEHGYNELAEKKRSPILMFLGFLWNPLSWAMEVAAIISLILLSWWDTLLILALLLLNATISYKEEHSAGNAIAALKEQLSPESLVMRDGEWKTLPARELVPGDLIKVNQGDIIAADAFVTYAVNVKVDQAALTGESLPVDKNEGDEIYSGAAVKMGQLKAIVTATGVDTFFGRAAQLVEGADEQGHFQKVLRAIGWFCISGVLIFVTAELLIQFFARDKSCSSVTNCTPLEDALVLIVGGVPIAMPTVLSVTMAIGAAQLSKKQAIVSRLTAVEELAGMDILCSDKTGTLTQNVLTMDKPVSYGTAVPEMIFHAALASEMGSEDAIDKVICDSLTPEQRAEYAQWEQVKYQPFDAYTKRAFALIRHKQTGKQMWVTKGAPQIVLALAVLNKDAVTEPAGKQIQDLAVRGYRTIGVAHAEDPEGTQWVFEGLLPLADPPRIDTKETIEKTVDQGIRVKMITGDQQAIAKELARKLGMGTNIIALPRAHGGSDKDANVNKTRLKDEVEGADGFSQVLPEDKYNIVEMLQKRGHTVAMTGDGVNDAPALKKADIGVAVAGATSAARAAADIVLLAPGLGVIVAAIIGARVIFQRMKSYSIYAVTVTVRFLLTFFILVVAWDFSFPTFLIVLLAICNDGTTITVSRDRVMPSQRPDKWRLHEIFGIAIVLGSYLTGTTLLMFVLAKNGTFSSWFQLKHLSPDQLRALIYLQVSITGIGVIFSIRTKRFFWEAPPGILLACSFVFSQLVATFIACYGLRGFPEPAGVRGIGWGWVAFAWVYSLICFLPLDLLKLASQYVIRGEWLKLIRGRDMVSARNSSVMTGHYHLRGMLKHGRHSVDRSRPPSALSLPRASMEGSLRSRKSPPAAVP